jgi:DNA repair exonuclease SbcCD ATPase subunit
MARTGVTREQVFETADALVRENRNPTVIAVRERLGGGSPNTINPLLGEWRALHEQKQAASIPAVPEPVETVLRQVWGTAWQTAQEQLSGERESLAKARQTLEQERTEMLAEIERLDAALTTTRTELGQGREALETERRAHEQTRGEAREARVLAEERAQRITALESEREQERESRREAETALNALKVEAATLTERAAHAEELRTVIQSLQDRQGGAAG